MNTLIVHDRPSVGEQIREIIAGICPKSTIKVVNDASTARARLSTEFYDLLILDLTIPTVSSKEAVGFHVAEGLLEELAASPALLLPANVVGITQDEDALYNIQNNIGPHLMAIIAEDNDGRWRQQLEDRVRYVLDSAGARSRALLISHGLDLLIITALDKELSAYHEFFDTQDNPSIAGVSDFAFMDKDGNARRGACFAIGRAGQASAASETQGLLCNLRPRLAIMSGFCGGVPGKADLGDILFAELALDWDYGKWKASEEAAKLYSRPEPVVIRNSRTHRVARQLVEGGLPDPAALNAAMALMSKGEIIEPKMRLAPFASGSTVIGNQSILRDISRLNENVAGIDMESYGFYFACKHAHAAPPEFICVKAVADACGPEKDDRLHSACSFASAHVAKAIATLLWDFTV